MEYNSSFFSEYQKLEANVDLARRYESKAVQLLDSVENEEEDITMTTIRDFEDNVRDVSSRIKLPNCSQVQDELCELNLWRSSYSRLIEPDPNQSQTEPPLSQAKSLLNKADNLKVLSLFDLSFFYTCIFSLVTCVKKFKVCGSVLKRPKAGLINSQKCF